MPNKKQTSPKVAKKASKILRDGRFRQNLKIGCGECLIADKV